MNKRTKKKISACKMCACNLQKNMDGSYSKVSISSCFLKSLIKEKRVSRTDDTDVFRLIYWDNKRFKCPIEKEIRNYFVLLRI